jgi:hypothetical protein
MDSKKQKKGFDEREGCDERDCGAGQKKGCDERDCGAGTHEQTCHM